MRYDYKKIDITTIKGIEQAERLQLKGWKIINNTPFAIIFEKAIVPKKKGIKKAR